MIVPGSANPLLYGSSKAPVPAIGRSLRIRNSRLSRTNTTTSSNAAKFTFSAWVKRGKIGGADNKSCGIFDCRLGASISSGWYFMPSNTFEMYYDVEMYRGTSTQFRDPSAWFHLVVSNDRTQTATGEISIIYVNGVRQPYTGAVGPAASWWYLNNGAELAIGSNVFQSLPLDGYLADIHLVDGQALAPTNFGETSPETGVWQPKTYVGSHGNLGFHLKFDDPNQIGKDSSGNNNHWTANNIDVAAPGTQATYDLMSDGPAINLGGTGIANYCTLNPLDKQTSVTSNGANLLSGCTTGTWSSIRCTIALPKTGKFYWEYTKAVAGSENRVGICDASHSITNYIGFSQYGYGYAILAGTKWNNQPSGGGTAYGAAANAVGDVIMVAYDADNGSLFTGKNGTWFAGSDPATNTAPMFGGIPKTIEFYPAFSEINSADNPVNFGQRPFKHTPPAGFKALCVGNLPDPLIPVGPYEPKHSAIVVDSGANILNAARAVFGEDGLIWVKDRAGTNDHQLLDSVRTFGNGALGTNRNGAPNAYAAPAGNSVAWVFKAGGAGSANNAGSISATVSANTTAGFSVVKYTGTGAVGSIGHGLGVKPAMIIVKRYNAGAAEDWRVWHSCFTDPGHNILVNGNTAKVVTAGFWGAGIDASVFGVGNFSNVNANGGQYIAYCFAQVAGYSAFGDYAGNSNADGPFVYLGFKPKYILIKNHTGTGGGGSDYVWTVYDEARGGSTMNGAASKLYYNQGWAENANTGDGATANVIDFLANGFKVRTANINSNTNGGRMLYMAFADVPFKFALAR
jgi:hypothetical protein